MSLQVLQLEVNNRNHNLSLEDLYRKYGAYAGIHLYHFDDRIRGFQPFTVYGVPVNEGVVTFQRYNNYTQIKRSSTDAPDTQTSDAWTYLSNDDMPHSYNFEFRPHVWKFKVVLNTSNPITNMGYHIKFSYDAKNVFSVERRTSSSPTDWKQIFSQNYGPEGLNPYLPDSLIRISVRDTPADYNTSRRITYINIWVDDMLLCSFSDNSGVVTGRKIAFNIVNSDFDNNPLPPNTLIFSDFRISNLNEVIEWSSLDPGETPSSAIHRAIEDRYIKSIVRWDGSLRAWRPNANSNSMIEIEKDRWLTYKTSHDERQVVSDLRLRGPFQWVRVADDELVGRYGRRFHEIDNTSLWSAEDCYNEALQIFIRIKEQVDRADIEVMGMFHVEPEDYISFHLPDDSVVTYIVDTINISRDGASLRTSLSCRKYRYA